MSYDHHKQWLTASDKKFDRVGIWELIRTELRELWEGLNYGNFLRIPKIWIFLRFLNYSTIFMRHGLLESLIMVQGLNTVCILPAWILQGWVAMGPRRGSTMVAIDGTLTITTIATRWERFVKYNLKEILA